MTKDVNNFYHFQHFGHRTFFFSVNQEKQLEVNLVKKFSMVQGHCTLRLCCPIHATSFAYIIAVVGYAFLCRQIFLYISVERIRNNLSTLPDQYNHFLPIYTLSVHGLLDLNQIQDFIHPEVLLFPRLLRLFDLTFIINLTSLLHHLC